MNFDQYLETSNAIKMNHSSQMVIHTLITQSFNLAFNNFSDLDFLEYVEQYKTKNIINYQKDIKNIVMKFANVLNEKKYRAILDMGINFTEKDLLSLRCQYNDYDFLDKYLKEFNLDYLELVFSIIQDIKDQKIDPERVTQFFNIKRTFPHIGDTQTINYCKIMVFNELLKHPKTLFENIDIYGIDFVKLLIFIQERKSKDENIKFLDYIDIDKLSHYINKKGIAEKTAFIKFINHCLSVPNYASIDTTTTLSTLNNQNKVFTLLKYLNESFDLDKSKSIIYLLAPQLASDKAHLGKDSFILDFLNSYKTKSKKDSHLSQNIKAHIEKKFLNKNISINVDNHKPMKI